MMVLSLEATVRFELTNQGVADPRLTTWLCRHMTKFKVVNINFKFIIGIKTHTLKTTHQTSSTKNLTDFLVKPSTY